MIALVQATTAEDVFINAKYVEFIQQGRDSTKISMASGNVIYVTRDAYSLIILVQQELLDSQNQS